MIQTRVFLVGCPRSGTTYLQSLLAAHPAVTSLPETHFFRAVTNNWRAHLGLASPKGRERRRLRQLLATLQRPDLAPLIPRFSLRLSAYIGAFQAILDKLAEEQGNSIWVEKTPDHLHYIRHIERYIPAVKFVHLTRQGEDTVASLYAVARQHPELWGGSAVVDVDWCIARWNHDIRLTEACLGRPNHYLVQYEQLQAQTQATLQALCDFLGLTYAPEMQAGQASAAEALILSREPWKAPVKEGPATRAPRKFETVFTPDVQAYVQSRLVTPIWSAPA